ncbi:hypothetical protein AX15_004153 [Amanita polypyramis BW_CC]|nr:hypothetical protein AX15_004153 [Amanita polypyramis BW_CC]
MWAKRPCHIGMFPNEILYMIFGYFSRLSSSGRGQVPPIVLLSHISRLWRHVAFSVPALWDRLHVYSVRHPDVLRAVLARSLRRSLSIRIELPKTIFWSGDEIPEFDETCRVLVEQLPRIRSLSITARNFTLRRFTDKVLVNTSLPHLQHLELVSCLDSSLAVLGPFNFNPHVFVSLRIERTMIQVKDGGCLSGLQSLIIWEAPLTYLDERKIPSFTYPLTPMNWYADSPPPSLSHLVSLKIHMPLLHPVPGRTAAPIMNSHGLPIQPLPFAPSFREDILRSVTLSSLSLSKMAYHAEATSDALARLFFIISIAELVELNLIDLRDQAAEGFLQALSIHHCRFSHLRVLRLDAVRIDQIVQHQEVIGLENFRALFSGAFPVLGEVRLSRLNPAPLVETLSKVAIWPMLRSVVYDGQVLNVRLP